MIMVPRRSNRAIKFAVAHESESVFDLYTVELARKAYRIVLYELEELEFLLENECIQSYEGDKIRTLVRHLEFIVSFIGNSDDYPALETAVIPEDLVIDIVSVVEDLSVDIERYALDEAQILGRGCFLHHSHMVENLVKKIESVKEQKLVGSLGKNPSLSYNVDREAVIGFEDALNELRERLVGGLLKKVKLEVIPIIGMAGIGKTTLASILYNHPSVIYSFHIRVWICLSKSYEKKNILHGILSCIVSENDPILLMSVDDMEKKVYNCLRKNRYLIVLDDIWDVQIWNDLKGYFPENIYCSKILMTSRIEDVALNTEVGISKDKSNPYYLPRLTEDNSWLLFRSKVFGTGNIPGGLSGIAKKIVEKCNGLPLLIVVLAKLLAKEKKTKRYWRQVAENMSSVIHKIMHSPCSNHILTEMLVDHQFITIARRAVELELEDLELLLDHESFVFSRRDEILSLVQDLKLIHSFITNVQESPTLQALSILDFVLEIKFVVENLLDETDLYIHSKIFIDLEYCQWNCFLEYCQNIASIVSEIKSINKDSFNFQGSGSSSHEALSIQEACSSSILEEKTVIGFDDQQKELLDRLIGGRKQLEVVPIIGMAGIGKTTLANMLYNHWPILCHFHVRAWTSLSQSYQKKNLLHDILSSIVCEDDPVLFMSEDDMGEKLYKSLMGNRYLIALDDVWDFQAWTDMERYFPNNENGSRILMTSRIEDVALNIRMNSCPYYLPILSEDKSWELFQCKVFGNGNIPGELKEIGKRIVTRCKGLPLAIVVIAGLLSKEEKTEQCWRRVGENIVCSSINNDLKQLMDILALSYKHLPSSLKSCFLYFGLFPEDSEIPVSTLIKSWIAEGFIQPTEDKRLEEVAEEFLLNLVSRNLVMVAKKSANGRIKSLCIHDLLRDMCLQMGEEKKFVQLVCRCASNSDLFNSKTLEGKQAPSSFSYCQYFHFYKSHYVSESEVMSTEVLSVYKYLQVLDLRHIRLINFPRKILELLHLKFLALHVARIKMLPYSLFDLWNLETFILEGEKGGKLELTPEILKMNKLRHFQISQELFCDEVTWMDALQGKSFDEPRKQGKHNPVPMLLDNLQTFSTLCPSNFVAVTFLPRFQSLRKLGLHLTLSETTAKDVLFPDLSCLIILEKLNFEYQTFGMVDFSIPHPLVFPPSLKKLTLIGTHCKWSEMSILGVLQNLEVLKLKDNSFSGPCCWETCDDGFPQLKYLKLSHMDLQHWISSSSHFPKLQHLVLNGCLDLEQIPLDIGDILTLQTIEVYRSSDSAAESAKQILEIQNSLGNEHLKIFLYQQFQEF